MENRQQRTKQAKYQFGATVIKRFNGKFYTGEITEYGVNGGCTTYNVVHEEDGDAEVMLEEDMNIVIVTKRDTM